MSLIGLMCKRGDTFSLQVLIGRGLFLLLLLTSSPSALRFISSFKEVGVYCAEVTPVPIPNTEVKLCRENNTWLATAWENISMPALLPLQVFPEGGFVIIKALNRSQGLYLFRYDFFDDVVALDLLSIGSVDEEFC